MSDDATPLSLPSTLPFPLTITRLLISAGATIKRGDPLFQYSFTSTASRQALARREKGLPPTEDDLRNDVRENDMVGTWDSAVAGEVVKWYEWVAVGTKVDVKMSKKPAILVQQPCTHPVQLHGMCGICGADITQDDYLTRPEPEPLPGTSNTRQGGGIEMSHDSLGVTVSSNEAKRLENQIKEDLLKSRKLTLIVDLDQTIIHTTVDPTVGEWMAEIERDEVEEKKGVSAIQSGGKEKDGSGAGPSTTPQASPRASSSVEMKEKNPNADALRDVARFTLQDDLPPGYKPPKKAKGKTQSEFDRYYYTKPRPGLQVFLDEMSKLYEMHVYTMGTRTYADAICQVIDPDKRIFGGRILSRDESGSFSSKNLKRLFPTDQSMVVVIDDRSDVWADIPNLVKVVPYDFFLGIGDINGSFLPPVSTPASTAPTSPKPSNPASPASSISTQPPETPPEDQSLVDRVKLMDEVSESRPLAKMQAELEKEDEISEDGGQAATEVEHTEKGLDRMVNPVNELGNINKDVPEPAPSVQSTTPPGSPVRHRKPLLNPNDYELDRLSGILTEIHGTFYRSYNSRSDKQPGARLPMACDVEQIIPDIKSRVFEGCTIVFSGMIPRDQVPEASEIFQIAETFGALPVPDLTADTTHCIAANTGTSKVCQARKAGIQVLWTDWFWKSVALWTRQDEREFLAFPDPGVVSAKSTNGSNTPAVREEGNDSGHLDGGLGLDAIDGLDFDEDEIDMDGWDDDDDEEAGGDGSSIFGGTDDEGPRRSVSPTPSTASAPGTLGKKRVRYADEESLPLETFKDPSPDERREIPDAKRRKPLLLEGPGDAEVPAENRFEWKGKMRDDSAQPLSSSPPEVEEGVHAEENEEADAADGEEGRSEAETEDDDFSQLLMESLGGEEED